MTYPESRQPLDEKSAMRKLAWIWRLADIIGKVNREEAIRLLRQFEKEERAEMSEEEEPAVPTTKPELPKIPEKSYPDPERRKSTYQKAASWNIEVELAPPETDGTWPADTALPSEFPFSDAELIDGQAIRALFKRPETWDALSKIAADPAKRGMIQSYLLPKIVLAVGKRWWDINKYVPHVGSAPFGLFAAGEYKEYKKMRQLGAKTGIDKTDVGKAYISLINWRVAKIFQYYLAKGTPSGDIDGYLYSSLQRRMTLDAGKRLGFDAKRKPTCAYCQFKRVVDTTPPVMAQTKTHAVQEEGHKLQRQILECPTCNKIAKEKEHSLLSINQEIKNTSETIGDLKQKAADAQKELEKDPKNRELHERVIRMSGMVNSLESQNSAREDEKKDLSTEIDTRLRMQNVPYTHIVCIRENCPGSSIPLTFVDWNSPFWQTEEGKEAKRKLESYYGIVKTAEAKQSKTPPKWMWNVPFRCPFDGAEFTPQIAFGKGKLDSGGRPMGGLFTDPPRTTIWEKPESLEESETEAKKRIEDMRSTTGINQTTDSDSFITDQNEKLFYEELASTLRQEIYRRMLLQAKKNSTLSDKKKEKGQRMLAFYEAVLEWSYTHPLHLVGYFTKRLPVVKKVIDGKEGEVVEHLALAPGDAEKITSGIMQTWFSKMLKQKDGWLLVTPYLTSTTYDLVPPRSYFLSVVRQRGDVLEAPCLVGYGENSPIGESSPRGSNVGKRLYMALVEEIYDYDGTPSKEQMMAPIPYEAGYKLSLGKTNRINEMETHDSSRIIFDPASTLHDGSVILVRALFMPRQANSQAQQQIAGLRKDFGEEDEMAGSMESIARILQEKENDVKTYARFRKALKQSGMPEQLKKFDEMLRTRLGE